MRFCQIKTKVMGSIEINTASVPKPRVHLTKKIKCRRKTNSTWQSHKFNIALRTLSSTHLLLRLLLSLLFRTMLAMIIIHKQIIIILSSSIVFFNTLCRILAGKTRVSHDFDMQCAPANHVRLNHAWFCRTWFESQCKLTNETKTHWKLRNP